MISPLYMAEISPPEVRGSLMALEQFSIVLGVVFGFWAGFFTRGSAEFLLDGLISNPDQTDFPFYCSRWLCLMAHPTSHSDRTGHLSRDWLTRPSPITKATNFARSKGGSTTIIDSPEEP